MEGDLQTYDTKFNTQHNFHFLGKVLFCVNINSYDDCQLSD